MYRQYEDPRKLERMLEETESELETIKAESPDDDDRLIDLYNEVESLKERINFAWQDDEYDEQYAMEDDWRPGDAPWNAPGMSVSDFIR